MSKKDKSKESVLNTESGKAAENQTNNNGNGTVEQPKAETVVQEEQPATEEYFKLQINEMNDRYLRLVAEFDNYKKRTLRERIDLIKTAGEDVLKEILPIVDDFERALSNIDQSKDIEAVKTGVNLIYGKFSDYLKQKGIVSIEALHTEFDTDMHEAITKIPAPSDELKGKVVDVVKKGYCLNDKVIRFAQVVIGE